MSTLQFLAMDKKTAIFPGSFDPFTKGHEDIVNRALALFDEIVIAIGYNASKQYMFDLEKRKAHIEEIYQNEPRVRVDHFYELTVTYAQKANAQFILRGIRNSTDMEFEKSICQMNKKLDDQIETWFIMTAPELSAINSTIVRDIFRHKGDISQFVSKATLLQ